MTEEEELKDIYYPVPNNLSLSRADKKPLNKTLVKGIIQNTIIGAYQLKDPSTYFGEERRKPTAVATQEQIDTVINLVEALEPKDAIEVALGISQK